jgi:hypothetical protein
MGQNETKEKSSSETSTHHIAVDAPSHHHTQQEPTPTFTGSATNVVRGALLDSLTAAMPYDHRQWTQVYDSFTDGRSFSRLAAKLPSCSATLFVIQERGEDGCIFGGYNSSPWLTTSQRDRLAKTNAAARERANRTGEAFSQRPADQLVQFFGSAPSFVFSSGKVVMKEGEAQFDANTIKVYPSRGDNSNFMYFFDQHPRSDCIGIGMGGAKDGTEVGFPAWRIDRFLSRGVSSVRICPTFRSPRLTSESEYAIDRIIVFCVDGSFVPETSPTAKKSILQSQDVGADKMILELHNQHHFYGDDVADEKEEGSPEGSPDAA